MRGICTEKNQISTLAAEKIAFPPKLDIFNCSFLDNESLTLKSKSDSSWRQKNTIHIIIQ